MNKEYFKKKGVRWGVLFGVMAVAFLLSTQMIPTPKLEKEPQWHILWEGSLAEATEASPAAGASGFLEIFFVNHTAIPATAYDTNTSSEMESWANTSLDADGATGTTNHAYAIADNFNLTVQWGEAMDIVIRVRFNKTHAFDGSIFQNTSCRVNLTTTGGGIVIAGTTGTNIVSSNATDHTYIWINCYWNNAHSGYTLSKNGICLITTISIQAKY
jgi:hypothetical protein